MTDETPQTTKEETVSKTFTYQDGKVRYSITIRVDVPDDIESTLRILAIAKDDLEAALAGIKAQQD